MKTYVIVLLALTVLTGCFDQYQESDRKILVSALSPSNHKAVVIETANENSVLTQVFITFNDGVSGIGVVHAYRSNLGLELEWETDQLLVVTNKSGVSLSRNASGQVLKNGQFTVEVLIRTE